MAISVLNGQEVASTKGATTQVYKVTHDGAGNRLPYMYRSFISFTYGGKNIEDFDLIAVTEGDRLNRNLFADFNDIVTSPEVTDGRFYWGTHYNNNALELNLFTDCITQKQLDDFKLWFQPGIERELILAENPFRGIMARVGSVTTMSMIPIEYPVNVKLAGQTYKTSITKYQGSIRLNFVMDDPFWYSLYNVLDYQVDGSTGIGSWKGIDDNVELIVKSPDALKVLYEDRIPTLSMFAATIDGKSIQDNVARGDNNFTTSSTANEGSAIGSANITGYKQGVTYQSWVGLRQNTTTGEGTFGNFVPGYSNRKYFYYAGTAPSLPTITFSMTINSSCFNSSNYFNAIGNEYATSGGNAYSTITAEATEKHELKITTPSLFTAYNQAVYILGRSFSTTLERDEALRDGVHHKTIRDLAISSHSVSSLKSFLIGKTFTFTINCKTGTVKMAYSNVEEDAGDMIVSNYMKIIERNRLDDNGYVNLWDNNKEYSHILYHNLGLTLNDVGFLYKYMYL